MEFTYFPEKKLFYYQVSYIFIFLFHFKPREVTFDLSNDFIDTNEDRTPLRKTECRTRISFRGGVEVCMTRTIKLLCPKSEYPHTGLKFGDFFFIFFFLIYIWCIQKAYFLTNCCSLHTFLKFNCPQLTCFVMRYNYL